MDSLPFHSSQKVIKMEDESVDFSLFVNVSEELIRAILSYGGEIMVLEPKTLKDELQRRAKKILEN